MPRAAVLGEQFHGFDGLAFALLVLACIAGGAWLVLLGWRWFATFPYLPDAAPATNDLGDEPPAVVNFLVNRWKVTRGAMAATLVDLAARKMLEIDQLDRRHFVVRLQEHRVEGQALTAYERQALDFVRSRATGGSAPAESLLMADEAAAKSWWKRFEKAVIKDARERGLARARWAREDWVMLGTGLAIALGLFAAAFGTAHLLEGSGSSDDEFGRWDWFIVAGIAWFVVMGFLMSRRDVRDTPEGDAVCARWLGVRAYLRETKALGDAPLASVIIWERYLAYGIALGTAHEAAEALPFEAEDPEIAWSRSGGDWHTLRISYPTRFGACQPPGKVFLAGLGLTAAAGVAAFYVLPLFGQFAWDLANDAVDNESLGTAEQDRALRIIAITLIAVLSGVGLFVLAHLVRGLVRLWRSVRDFGRAQPIEGDIVKTHLGRVAIDDGQGDEAVAWPPPRGTPGLARGMRIRILKTPNLHHVSRVEVLAGAPQAEVEVEDVGDAGEGEGGKGVAAAVDAAFVQSLTGLPLALTATGPGAAIRTFADGAGNRVSISAVPVPGAAMRALGLFVGRTRGGGVPVAGLGSDAWWLHGRTLVVHDGGGLVTIDVELPGHAPEQRQEVARRVAERVAKGA